jgi:hypothetical protein
MMRMRREAYLSTAASCLRTSFSAWEPHRLRTLGENEKSVPSRSPSAEKGDIDASHPPKQSREHAGSPSDTCDLMSPLWGITDTEGADPTTGQPPHHACASILTKRAPPVMFSGSMPWFSGSMPWQTTPKFPLRWCGMKSAHPVCTSSTSRHGG